MTRLIDDLLDASRIQRGKLRLEKRPIELARVVAGAVEAARLRVSTRRHELTASLPPEALYLEADPTRLTQIFVNLLSNAARYTPDGGHIARSAERDGADVVVRVKDDGLGIPPDMLSKIFDPFTQAHHSELRSQEGLGIGLALVKGLVERHGGTVMAHSPGVGHGSEFVVRLPLMLDGRDRANQIPVKQAKPEARVESRRVLVVDDCADAAETLAMLLRIKGHDVRTAHDGPEAIKTAYTFRPEVVFLDIELSGMNGYEVARRLREQPVTNAMRLVALSGYGGDGESDRSREAGFDAHLVKPCPLEDVQEHLFQDG